jgi:hypothetical protein
MQSGAVRDAKKVRIDKMSPLLTAGRGNVMLCGILGVTATKHFRKSFKAADLNAVSRLCPNFD